MYEDYEQDLTSLDGKLPLLFAAREEMGGPAKKWAAVHTPNATIIAFGKHLNFWVRPDQFNAGLDKFLASVH
jgi:hypothetical protein